MNRVLIASAVLLLAGCAERPAGSAADVDPDGPVELQGWLRPVR